MCGHWPLVSVLQCHHRSLRNERGVRHVDGRDRCAGEGPRQCGEGEAAGFRDRGGGERMTKDMALHA